MSLHDDDSPAKDTAEFADSEEDDPDVDAHEFHAESDEGDDSPPVLSDDEEDEDSDQASLEELLAQRGAARRAGDESDDDTDIMSFASERPDPVADPLPRWAAPVKDRQEFVYSNCHLEKPRVQLSDPARDLCRDCI